MKTKDEIQNEIKKYESHWEVFELYEHNMCEDDENEKSYHALMNRIHDKISALRWVLQ